MPSLESWDPRPAIVHWIDAKKRRDRSPKKAKGQLWFKGIFETPSETPTLPQTADDQNKKQINKKRCF